MAEKREIITVEFREDGELTEEEITLGERSEEVDVRVQNREVRKIVAAIKAVMREKNLVCLSAPELGFAKRIFCIKFDGDIKAFVNPIIVSPTGLQLSRETCCCLPGLEYILPRNNDITIFYQKVTGEAETRRLVGMAAFVFQHAMNHLDGALISDFGAKVPENFDNFTDEEKEAFIAEYLDELDIKKKKLQEEYETDKEFKQLKDGIDFMESVVKGETKLVPAPPTEIPEIPNNKE